MQYKYMNQKILLIKNLFNEHINIQFELAKNDDLIFLMILPSQHSVSVSIVPSSLSSGAKRIGI